MNRWFCFASMGSQPYQRIQQAQHELEGKEPPADIPLDPVPPAAVYVGPEKGHQGNDPRPEQKRDGHGMSPLRSVYIYANMGSGSEASGGFWEKPLAAIHVPPALFMKKHHRCPHSGHRWCFLFTQEKWAEKIRICRKIHVNSETVSEFTLCIKSPRPIPAGSPAWRGRPHRGRSGPLWRTWRRQGPRPGPGT